MDQPSRGHGGLVADPIPYVRGLYQLIPEGRLAAILARTGRQSERRRRLPAESVAWLVIALALFAADSIPMAWRRLHPTLDEPEPTDSAFPQARRRLGVAPLRALFLEVARPMATHRTIGAFYRGWRLMGIDGTTLDLPDTPANARTFGRPSSGRAVGAFPRCASWPSASSARTPSAPWRSSRFATASRRWSARSWTTSGRGAS